MGIYIEIALSLILVFLVLSLVVTAINELIAMQLRKRPKMLIRTISALIDDADLRSRFYNNGIVVSAKEASAGSDVAVTDQNHPSYIAGPNFARALTMAALESHGNGAPLSVFTFKDVEDAVNKLPESLKIRDVLIGALSTSGGVIEQFETQMAAWFDTTQDRLTGEYARHQRLITLCVGAALVLFLNADAVRLTHELQSNDALRTAMVKQADEIFQKGINSACVDMTDDALEACVVRETRGYLEMLDPAFMGWDGDPALAGALSLYASAHDFLMPSATAAEPAPAPAAVKSTGNPAWLLLNKLVGLLITVMAVSLGAPFWFDMLNKVVNIRGAGIKPDKTAAPT